MTDDRQSELNQNEEPGFSGSYEAFLEAFSRNREPLYRYVYALVPHQADAEDVFQRCSIILWRKFSTYDPEQGSFLNWACGVAHYEVRNFLRTSKRDRHYFSPDLVEQLATSQQPKTGEQAPRLEALRECLQQLKQSERFLLEQAHYHQQSAKTLADDAGKGIQTIYNQLTIIRRKLFQCVQGKLAATQDVEGGLS
ncbi:RNA polymerase sigma factor [Polystyrenella longa]|uniref:RNA polymerase sigma factor n=1 Tax=Polystyrenella longa TaxID=2528007 RepID=A0A518CPT6_9PLAN|nr:sigma-70 family RNA polymerase sigma factor [Polystyrenella longa]QDU81235.1 RNA polymerase sigma factor [Polystyrenella longa]